MIQIYTYQNSLKVSEGKDKYCFRSVVDQTLDNEQLIKEITSYNSTITEAIKFFILIMITFGGMII